MEDIKILVELERLESEGVDCPNIIEKLKNEFGEKEDYGLSFDYVEEGTFKDQREPYIRFQISWGGPSEEFRFYANDTCEFWFLDWFKGEHIKVDGEDLEYLQEFLGCYSWEDFKTSTKKE